MVCLARLGMDDPQLSRLLLALTTEATAQQAETLALALLERRLVACVSLQPLDSLYLWNGALHRSSEVQLLLKTDARHLPELASVVHQLHSYDTPEWLVWPADSSVGYGRWLRASVGLSPDAGAAAP